MDTVPAPASSALSSRTPQSRPSGDIVASSGWQEFGNQHLNDLLSANGIDSSASDAACGPIAAAAVAKAFGIDTDPGQLAKLGLDKGWWNPAQGMSLGSGVGVAKLLQTLGIRANVLGGGKGQQQAIDAAQSGTPVILNFPNHYLVATDYNADTGQFYVGATASNALRGGQDWMTLDQIAGLAGAGGSLRSVVIPQGAPNPPDSSAPAGGAIAPQGDASPNPADTNGPQYDNPYKQMAAQAAQKYGIDPQAFVAQIQQESGYAPDVISGKRASSAGALGIAQFMPETARSLGVNPLDPQSALDGAARYMAQLRKQYGNDDLALIAYNGGGGAVRAYQSGQPYQESLDYLSRIHALTASQPSTTDQSALAPNTTEYHGQMQGADGTPTSQQSDPFGGIDQTSQYDPSMVDNGPSMVDNGSSLVGSDQGLMGQPPRPLPPSPAGTPMDWLNQQSQNAAGTLNRFGQPITDAVNDITRPGTQGSPTSAMAGPDPWGTSSPFGGPDPIGQRQAILSGTTAETPAPERAAKLLQGSGSDPFTDAADWAGQMLGQPPMTAEQKAQSSQFLQTLPWMGGESGITELSGVLAKSLVAQKGVSAAEAALTAESMLKDTGGDFASAAMRLGLDTRSLPRKILDTFIRMYHGTGSAFETPTPDKFDPNGLYGPGYYLTSDPRVATSYAGERFPSHLDVETARKNIADYTRFRDTPPYGGLSPEWWQSSIDMMQQHLAKLESGAGPNVRAVNVPRGLNLLDTRAPVSQEHVSSILAALPDREARMFDMRLGQANALQEAQGGPLNLGDDIYKALTSTFEGNRATANRVLASVGFDGIDHLGGQNMPLTDAAGNAVEHTAHVIFPESLPKLTNAFSGKAGGQAPLATAVHLGSAAAGAGLGYEADPNASPEERLRNAALGGVAGYGAARALTAGAGARGAYLSGLPIEGAGAADENLRAAQLVREENAARATGAPPLARPFTPASGLRDLQAEKRAFTFDASNLFHDLRQALPNPADRSDLTHAIEHPEARDALNPTQQEWLTKLTDTNEAAWQYAHDHGILDSYLENYISHIVQKPPEDVAKALSTGNRLSTFSQFTKQRTFPTIEDLQKYIADNHLPWKVHTDPAVIVPAHALSLQKAAANNAYLEMLKGATASDGRPLLTAAADAPRDYRTLASTALQKFKWQDTNAEGKPIFQTVPLSVHPEAYGPLERVLGEPLQTKVLPAPYWSVAGVLKRMVMYNPIVHGINTLSQAAKVSTLGLLDAGVLIGKGIHLLDDPASRPIVRQAIADGLNLASLREMGTELGTAMHLPLEIQQETSVLGRIGRVLAKPIHYSDALLWDKLVSGTQLGIHQTLKARFIQQGMAEADAGKRAAQMANNLSGMIPAEDLSRAGKFWGDLLLFANRWTQGALVRPLRGALGDVTPVGTKLAGTPFGLTPEDVKAMAPAYRGTVLRGMLSMAAITTGLNYALAGHGPWENDPGHLLDIDSGRRDASGNRIYYPNPLFRIEQELASGVADLVPGGAKATGTTLPSLAFAKTAQLPKEALSLGANENLGAMLKDNSPHPIYKAGDDFWTALGKVAQHAAQGLLPVRGVPIGAARIAGSQAGLLPPQMTQRGWSDVRGGLLNVYDKTTNLRLNEQQGALGDELRRLKVGVGVPAQKGLDDATYQAYRAALTNAQRDAFTRLLANPQYRSATDREKTLMLKDALRQTEATVGETYRGTRPPASGAPPKYTATMLPPELQSPKYQQDPYALERDVNAAVQAVADYRRGGGPLPSTREQYLALLTRYATPEWQQWAYEHRVPMAQQRSLVRSTVNDALGAMDAVPQPASAP